MSQETHRDAKHYPVVVQRIAEKILELNFPTYRLQTPGAQEMYRRNFCSWVQDEIMPIVETDVVEKLGAETATGLATL